MPINKCKRSLQIINVSAQRSGSQGKVKLQLDGLTALWRGRLRLELRGSGLWAVCCVPNWHFTCAKWSSLPLISLSWWYQVVSGPHSPDLGALGVYVFVWDGIWDWGFRISDGR